MIPTNFPESNFVLDKPPSMSHDECDPLCVHIGQLSTGQPAIVSCWKLTKDEVTLLLETGRLWLIVLNTQMPPVSLSVESPFK
jgi:hypothetical protein